VTNALAYFAPPSSLSASEITIFSGYFVKGRLHRRSIMQRKMSLPLDTKMTTEIAVLGDLDIMEKSGVFFTTINFICNSQIRPIS
jgi:hypothetical protein